MKLEIKRINTTVALVEIDEGTVFSSELLGMDKIVSVFYVETPLAVEIDDYIVFDGRKYTIKTATNCEQIDSKTYKYQIDFFGEIYSMYDELITHLGRTKFSYSANPLGLCGLLVDSLNAGTAGWSIGACTTITDVETFNFSEQSCRTALSDIAERFKLEYKVIDKKIYLLEKIGISHDITLQYGRGRGLVSANRTVVDKPFATIWYGFGGSQNLPANYRNGMDRVALSGTVEKNVNLYGRKKGSVTFENVFPQRTSTITSVINVNTITDTTIDFDLNAQTIGDNAKIVFKSGELSGQEFVITSYNHATKKIVFGSNKDDSGYVLPNATFSPAIGNKYTIIGIVMPQSYINAAEAEVRRLTDLHAIKNSYPPVAFPLDIDEKYIRQLGLQYVLKAGDTVKVNSVELGIAGSMRLQSVSFPLVNPCKITGLVSDSIQYTVQEAIVRDLKKANKDVLNIQELAIRNRKIADEIQNAAILNQFEKTYVGDLAVLSGAFVVGNPVNGQLAGLNGTGILPADITFFSGSSFADRDAAPFRVQQNGKVFATDLEAKNGCKIGAFEVIGNSFYRRVSIDEFAVNTNLAIISDYFLYRQNGATRGNVREVSFNLTTGGETFKSHTFKVVNSIQSGVGIENIALLARATNAQSAKNIAIKAEGEVHIEGALKMGNSYGRTEDINVRMADGSNRVLRFVNGILI